MSTSWKIRNIDELTALNNVQENFHFANIITHMYFNKKYSWTNLHISNEFRDEIFTKLMNELRVVAKDRPAFKEKLLYLFTNKIVNTVFFPKIKIKKEKDGGFVLKYIPSSLYQKKFELAKIREWIKNFK